MQKGKELSKGVIVHAKNEIKPPAGNPGRVKKTKVRQLSNDPSRGSLLSVGT